MKLITRRSALTAGAALPFAGALSTLSTPATAQNMMSDNAKKRGFMMGDFEVSTLLAGTRTVEDPQGTFGMNVSAEEFAEVSQQNFIPADKTQFFFTPTVVNTGDEVVLFDTGLNAEGTLPALQQAGYAPEDVTIVVITHMHGDHIGGLTTADGSPTYANARYVTGQAEFDHWAGQNNDGFEAKVRPLADKMTFIGDGGSVVSGITGMAAPGHTPGHMTYMLESGDKQLLVFADTANHYVWSLAHPEWEVRFDADKEQAAQTRKTVLGMLSADRVPFIGYHMPFPAVGYVEDQGDGTFRYVPSSYQMML
ncbi:MBL fold metallo-hydrolase [Pseudooceanicola sp. MF1-13]|uniref:MBL fold metallo-hydrolase n=1 Tax=Pseudooceanicola sp. MF1-13 TaxID=3379095 RepID=UPI0038918AA6